MFMHSMLQNLKNLVNFTGAMFINTLTTTVESKLRAS